MKVSQRLDMEDYRLALWLGAKLSVYRATLAIHFDGPTASNVRALACSLAMLQTCGNQVTDIRKD
jgi:hypothetical protein